jgi:hypothetical protein
MSLLVLILLATYEATSRAQYIIEHDARMAAEKERPQRDSDAKLEHFIQNHHVCAKGESFISLPDVDEPHLRETVRRKQADGWDVSLVDIDITGRCNSVQLRGAQWIMSCQVTRVLTPLRHNRTAAPFDMRCFLGTVWITAWPSASWFWGGQDKGVTSITVVRIQLPDEIPLYDDSPPALYQRRAHDIEVERERVDQQRSDHFLAQFLDENRIDPARDTYISLYRWPTASLRHVNQSVERLREDGWNATLMRIPIRGERHFDFLGSDLPCTEFSQDPGPFLTEAMRLGALLLSAHEHGIRERLYFECSDPFDAKLVLNRDMDVVFIAKSVRDDGSDVLNQKS